MGSLDGTRAGANREHREWVLLSGLIVALCITQVHAQANSPPGAVNNLAPTPPMGWNSWNAFKCAINETVIKQQADVLVSSGLAAAGYSYLVVDDCMLAVERDAQGNLQADPATFPSGIKALADYVHAKGLKFGIYADSGNLTCAGRAGSLDKEERDAATFVTWDIDFLKYDSCNDFNRDAPSRMLKMGAALRATGRPIILSLSNWGHQETPYWGSSSLANMWRVWQDITPDYKWLMQIIDVNDRYHQYSGPGYGWNDPDMLEVGNGLALVEERTQLSLWALAKAPLFIGTDLVRLVGKNATTLTMLVNSELLLLHQDPLGQQGYKRSNNAGAEVWAGMLTGGGLAVALVNRRAAAADISATWGMLELPLDVTMSVRDIWKRENLNGSFMGQLGPFTVASHDTVLLVLTPEPGYNMTSADLSTRAPAVASSEAGPTVAASSANDGDVNTIWTSGINPTGADSSWWQVDLGEAYHITRIELTAGENVGAGANATRTNFHLRGSNSSDGSPSVLLAAQGGVPFPPGGKWSSVVHSRGMYRYVRLVKTDNQVLSVAEIRVFGNEEVPPLSNLALMAPAEASSSYSSFENAPAANDDATGSAWRSADNSTEPQWWQVDLGGEYRITRLELVLPQAWDEPSARARFEVQGSLNSGDCVQCQRYHTVLAVHGNDSLPFRSTFTASVDAIGGFQYIRVAKLDQRPFGLAEVRVYGDFDITENLALARPSSASTTGADFLPYGAAYGNDGSLQTAFKNLDVPQFTDARSDVRPWWQVDLGRSFFIDQVELRSYWGNFPYFRANFSVLGVGADGVSSSVLGEQGAQDFDWLGAFSVSVNLTTSFRYVRIEKTPVDYFGNRLQFTELRVYGQVDSNSSREVLCGGLEGAETGRSVSTCTPVAPPSGVAPLMGLVPPGSGVSPAASGPGSSQQRPASSGGRLSWPVEVWLSSLLLAATVFL